MMRRSSARQKELLEKQRLQRQKNRRYILLGAGAVVVILLLLIIVPQLLKNKKPALDFIPITPVPRLQAHGLSMGDPNAPVKLDIYEDFQCPMCKAFSEQIEPSVVQAYVDTGKVYYTFHQFPFIDTLDSAKKSIESHQAANASMCANEQGRFWDYRDLLFTNWLGENAGSFSNERLLAFARSLDLNMGQFTQCFNAFKYRNEVEQDLVSGDQLGLQGTPAVFVDGKEVKPGYMPTFADMKTAIDAALAIK